MKIEEKIEQLLIDSFLWPDQAKEIILEAKSSKLCESMLHRWQDNITDYSETAFTSIWFTVSQIAKDWLEKNAPQHISISMFQ